MSSKQRNRRLGLLLCSIFTCLPCYSVADEQKALNSIVMVAGPLGKIGSGILVGEDAENIYIVTAHHVVWDPVDEVFEDISVEFRQASGYEYPAEIASPGSVSTDPAVDLAVLRVRKSHQLTSVRMPSVGRTQRQETPQSVQFVGRKSDRSTWRGTPLFDVAGETDSAELDERNFAARSFFPLQGFSGGGAFDPNWRLAGMTIAGGLVGTDFDAEEYTVVVRIPVVVEFLKSAGIPTAPYLAEQMEQRLTGDMFQRVPTQTLMSVPHPFGKTIYLNAINAYPEYAHDVKIDLAIEIDGKLHLWDTKRGDMTPMQSDRHEYVLPSQTTRVVACLSSKLPNRTRSISVVTLDQDTSQGLTDGLPSVTAGDRFQSLAEDPCRDKLKPQVGTMNAMAKQYAQLANLSRSEMHAAFRPEYVHIGTENWPYNRDKQGALKAIIGFSAGGISHRDGREYTVRLALKGKNGQVVKLTLGPNDMKYGELVQTVDAALDADAAVSQSCMASKLSTGGIVGVTQTYEKVRTYDVLGATHSVEMNSTYRAQTMGAGYKLTFGDSVESVCKL